tara:strand:- start:615 stop:1304 length:690 start_codon:yes stop_codon:yes gene_type:complete
MKIIKGDIHMEIKKLESNKYDLLYTDPPFSITSCKWDKPLKWNELWVEIWRVMKPSGVVILHSSMPFTYHLIKSQNRNPKYHYIWIKNRATGMLSCKYQPLRKTEEVLVYYKKKAIYNPQMVGDTFYPKRNVRCGSKSNSYYGEALNKKKDEYPENEGHIGRFPNNIIDMPIRLCGCATRPKQMIEYFIKTYSNINSEVLDITCSDCITGKVCNELKRNYTGIDLNPII